MAIRVGTQPILRFYAGPVPSAFDTDYQAVLDYATLQGYTLPSSGQQTLQNQLVLDLKASGAWAGMSIFYNMATDGDSDFAGINWVDPNNFELTPINSPTFTTNSGFTGNGTSMVLDTGFVPSTDWGSSTDVSMGGWATLNGSQGTIIGSFVTERTHLLHKFVGDGQTYAALGGNSGTFGTPTQTSGLWVVDNSGAGTNRLYVNGSLIATRSISFAGWSSVSLSIIARKRSNTPTFDNYGGGNTYKMAFYGTRTVGQNIYTPFNDYLNAI